MDAKVIARFMRKVVIQDRGYLTPCWIWVGSLNGYGYGQVRYQCRLLKAYCFSYEIFIGPIPEGHELHHLCHDPKTCTGGNACPHRPCVNPYHLDPVTKAVHLQLSDTVKLLVERNRKRWAAITHCPYGHPYDEKNTILRARGHRNCRECARIHQQALRDKRKQALAELSYSHHGARSAG